MTRKYKIKNLKGYLILLISFIGLIILKEIEVWAIKKIINEDNLEIIDTK